jgi:hypothetical protein
MRVCRAVPVVPISDAEIINISPNGIALRTRVPLKPGDRLSFSPHDHFPAILGEVLGVEPLVEGYYRVRCRCLLGSFEQEPVVGRARRAA